MCYGHNFVEYIGSKCNVFVTLFFIAAKWVMSMSVNTCLQHNGANIQLLDLPGIIEGAAQGKQAVSVLLIDWEFCMCNGVAWRHNDRALDLWLRGHGFNSFDFYFLSGSHPSASVVKQFKIVPV